MMVELSRRHFVSSVMAAAVTAAGRPRHASGGNTPAATSPSHEVKTGGVRMIPIVQGKYRVWTKKVGNGPIKLLTLHGGPGATHEIFECFEDFLPQSGIELYYYDQLDSHYSDQPGDPSLWTVQRYCDEVEEVRAGLGVTDFYLYGQSWGGMLAIEYALKYPQHLRGLVISSMTASIASYVAYMSELRRQLPPDVIAILDKYEAKGEYEAPEYQDVMLRQIYGRHMCRLDPWPEPLTRCFKHANFKVYGVMQGPNEFVVTGTFKDWDRWKDLPSIKVPTLLMGARYDEMNPADIRREADLIPNSRLHICENGSHLAQWDDQEDYMATLVAFLKDVQAGRFPAR